MNKLTHSELLARQENSTASRLPFCILLNNIRSLYNVGSIFRTADGAGLEKIWISGVTGFPPDNKIAKTALGAEKSVPWEYVKDARSCLQKLKSEGYQIVMLEQAASSVAYQHFQPKRPFCLVLGNEIGGVDSDLSDLADAVIEIGMVGLKISLNVAVAFGIVAYHYRNLLSKSEARNPPPPFSAHERNSANSGEAGSRPKAGKFETNSKALNSNDRNNAF